MSEQKLRKALIRLAFAKPELREHVLPLLRSAAKALSPEKLQEILLKIRKGATASLTLSQIQAVVEHLGGKMEMGVKVVPHPQNYAPVPDGMTDEQVRERFKPYLATSAPAKPKPGLLFVMKLPPSVEKRSYRMIEGIESLVSVPTVEISLGGKSGSVLGDIYNDALREIALEGKPQLISKPPASYKVMAWLKSEAGLVERVNQALNMEAHAPAEQRTRDGTGHCSVCLQNVKLKNDKIVLHGYRRPGYGAVQGKCFGTGYAPYELSDEGTKSYLTKRVQPQIKDVTKRLLDLKANKVTSLSRPYGVIIPTDPRWEKALSATIRDEEQTLRSLQEEEKRVETLIRRWKVRPLPVEGGPLFRLD